MKHENIFFRQWRGVVAVGLVMSMAGCASGSLSTREKGALAGGGLGAATGAIIGSTVGSPGAGAAIGGALGAVGGGLTGDQLQRREQEQDYQQRQIEENRREVLRQQREIEDMRRYNHPDHYEY